MSAKKPKVFVTGASGRIGSRLVEVLINNGYKVIVLSRNFNKIPDFGRNIEVISADILEINKYKEQMRSCDFIFHLAAYQNMFDRKIDEFERVNIDGTKVILGAMAGSKVKKLFYISTTMVLGKKDMSNFYVNTKSRALDVVKKSHTPWIAIYPSIVIDLNNKSGGWLWNLLTGGIPGGLMMRTGNKNRKVDFIWINDLVESMVKLINNGVLHKDYILKGESITVENYLKMAHKKLGKRYIPWRIPFF